MRRLLCWLTDRHDLFVRRTHESFMWHCRRCTRTWKKLN